MMREKSIADNYFCRVAVAAPLLNKLSSNEGTKEGKKMAKYRKKPVEVEAFQFRIDPMPDWFLDKVLDKEVILKSYGDIDEAHCQIKTPKGLMRGDGGDYIIRGIEGEIYPCKPDIFKETYEEI